MMRDTKYFRFGPVRQERGAKHLRYGDLLEAINVSQTDKAGVYAKRKGFSRTAVTYSGGSLNGTPVCTTEGEYGDTLMRDSGRQLWSLAAGDSEWIYRGTQKGVWPELTSVLAQRYTKPQPFSCVVGTNLWVFALTTNAYELTIVDTATGAIETSRTSVTATGVIHASAVYDGTNVWVFWVDGASNGNIYAHKFTVATPTVAPVATTFYTFPAAATDPGTAGVYNLTTLAVQQVQAVYLSSSDKVFVAACGSRWQAPNFYRGAMHAYLDAATGTATSATISLAYVGAAGFLTLGSLNILDGQDGSGTYLYLSYSGCANSGTPGTYYTVEWGIVAASLVALVRTNVYSSATTAQIEACAGVVDSGRRLYIRSSQYSGNIYGVGEYIYTSTYHHVSGTTVTTVTTVSLGSSYPGYEWIASKFSKVGSTWYCLTAHDDFAYAQTTFGTEAQSLQRMYHVTKVVVGAAAASSTITMEAQVDPGQGPAIFHKASAAFSIPAAAPLGTCCPPMHTINNELYAAIAIKSTVTGFVDVAIMNVELDKSFGLDCSFAGRGVTPGNIPMVWSSKDIGHEISPLTFPSIAKPGIAVGADYNVFAAVYAIYDSDGTVWRSAPLVYEGNFAAATTFQIQGPLYYLPGTRVDIEIYIGTGTAKLQTVVPNPSGTYLYTVPALAAAVDGEPLYTTGGALSQTWPVPCQAVGSWRNRVFLARDEDIWFSREIEPGFGPLFNEVMVTYWSDADNNIAAMGPVDSNYFAVVSSNRIGVISGPGPDGLGNGNYTIQTLSAREGISIGYPIHQGPSGAYFQDTNTGRLHCITPSLGVVECAGGAYDYSSYVVNSISWHDRGNRMIFWAKASQAAIIIDYNHTDDAAPFGQTELWTFDSTLGAYSATVDNSSLLFLDSGGHLHRKAAQYTDTTSTGSATYQMKLTTGELQMADLQGAFNIEKLMVLLAMRGASGVIIGVYPGYAHASLADSRVTSVTTDLAAPTNPGDTESIMTRPANCYRIQSFRVVIQEKAAISTQSFEFEGLAVEYTATGKMLRPAETRII